ncbi:hypothetical protein [Streptomyces gardneri]|uniref:hypothetical protein n=1 Tax=Streptomyces gardneri TaxID=66892 RepID=UPI0033E40F63
MDIPDWFVWIALGLTVLQALGLVPVIRRMSGTDPAVRSKARLDLLETVGALLLFVGIVLILWVAETWVWPSLAGFGLMTTAHTAKGLRRLRARRRATA